MHFSRHSSSFIAAARPDQPGRRPADHHGTHAAALGHVHHLLLRRPAQRRQAVLARHEPHHRVKRLDMHRPVRPDHRELVDRDAGQLLHDPPFFVGQGLVDRPFPFRRVPAPGR